ncbi:MAG: Eco57I restriction-modification methylase domain-containing protein [Leptospira sp.]|nr:Eco57I restriction-modification methylase domain-containing protein [Leptospira sp.]
MAVSNMIPPQKALNDAYKKVKPTRDQIESFKKNLMQLLDRANDSESEEYHKNLVSDFLKDAYYKESNHFINTKGRNDLVIHNGSDGKATVGVILEAKKVSNKSEMVTSSNLNTKAFQELVLYFLRERIAQKNHEVKHLVITNFYDWFIFDAKTLDQQFAQNKEFVQKFKNFEAGILSDTKTDFFYKEIASPYIESLKSEIQFTHFNLKDYEEVIRNENPKDDVKLISLYKLLSPQHLLKLPFANDSNSLDKTFYSELLYIIGLTEVKEGSKKLIQRNESGNRNSGAILEETINQIDVSEKIHRVENPNQFGKTKEERLFNLSLELCITWINRILFLKLLEAQLITYHKGDSDYAFLNYKKISSYDDLNSLFFQVLARKHSDRSEEIRKRFEKVPYLNSSLFELTDLEDKTFMISALSDSKKIPIKKDTVLRDGQGKKRSGEITTLEYLFAFLDAYDFSSEGAEEIQEENKSLINASVLGLIFEKLNGYKDGSYFTPGFITMYMCRETIRKAVVEKFNERKNWNCENLDDVYNKIEDHKEANQIINDIKICDPAVGSGHFLVSALNEIIAVKSDLKVLTDTKGRKLKEYESTVENDELIVKDEEGNIFQYDPGNKEKQRVQEALFQEKQTIIENCLFGVDINPNSVKICRLRLWIELLKNAYYKNQTELETLPNIDINIKCGNSLISRFPLDVDLGKALKKTEWNVKSYRQAVDTYRNAETKEQKREMEKFIQNVKDTYRGEFAKNDKLELDLKKIKGNLFNLINTQDLFETTDKQKKDLEKQITKLKEEEYKKEKEIEEIKSNKIYENAFEWRFEFPEVLDDDGNYVGFDVVIGNPPYGIKLDSSTIENLKLNYQRFAASILQDSYISFIALGLSLGNNRNILSYIIPNTWRLINIAKEFRRESLEKYGLYKIDTFLNPIFDEAVVDCDITFYSKANNEKIYLNINSYDKLIKINQVEKTILSAQNVINTHLTDKDYKLIEKIYSQSKLLKDVMTIKNGVKPYEVGKGKPKQTKTILKEKPYTKDHPVDDTFLPLIGGSDFHKFVLKWNHDNFISYGSWLAAPRDPEIFERDEKIIVRQTSDRIISTLVGKGFIMRNNTHILLPLEANYKLKYNLGLLNSKLIDFVYWTINPERGEPLAEVKAMHLDQLPIKLANDKIQNKIESLVDNILSTKKQNPSTDTSDLEAQIDQLVYQLYELTPEEIAIVEESVK